MRRGTTPSPLAGEGRGEGKAYPRSPLVGPSPRGGRPGPTKREILHGVQNDNGEWSVACGQHKPF